MSKYLYYFTPFIKVYTINRNMSILQSIYKLTRLNLNKLKNFTYHGTRLVGDISGDKLKIIETAYSKFSKAKSKSLLKKHLTKDVFNNLKKRQTSFNSTLLDCVQSGFANLDSNIGVYAPDAEAYTVFAELFDRVIEDYHNGFTKCSVHPNINFGNLDCFKDLDPERKYVVSIRIRCGRSIHGYPFNPCLKEHQYRELEDMVTKALSKLKNELKGEYYPLCAMDNEFKKCLIDNHFLFKEGDRFLKAANATRFWPLGRGIFFNEDTTFLVWVNEEDHIRIISMQKGGDIHAVYGRLVEGAKTIGTLLQFSRHKRLGYLTFCPTNLGKCALQAAPDAETMEKMENGIRRLLESDSKSLLAKYLSRDIFDKIKMRRTSFGSTLLDCIQSGLENLDSGVGIYAPDAEAYRVFAEIFDPILEDYHNGFKPTDRHPKSDFGDVNTLVNVDPSTNYVVSIRVRCGRSLEGYPFNPCLKEEEYREIEKKVTIALGKLEGELVGQYQPLTGMDKTIQKNLIDSHFLFKEGDRFLQAANASRYWPTGRGIYFNEKRTFLVWINEEDHIRIISMEAGGDLGACYRRFVNAVNSMSNNLGFSRDDRLGFLTFCPTNLGTTIRASVHIKLPKLSKDKVKFEEVASKFNLQIRGTSGEHSESIGGVYDISNKQRIGLTEYQAVKTMQDGILEMIKIEQSL